MASEGYLSKKYEKWNHFEVITTASSTFATACSTESFADTLGLHCVRLYLLLCRMIPTMRTRKCHVYPRSSTPKAMVHQLLLLLHRCVCVEAYVLMRVFA